MIITLNAQELNATPSQAKAIATLETATGFASFEGVVPTTNWKVSPVQNINAVVGFKVSSLYRKQVEALKGLTLADIDTTKWIPSKGKNSCDNAQDQFDICVAKLIESKITTLNQSVESESLDAHRLAHKACYITIHNSIKVHLVTEKNEDGKMRPVLAENGLPTVKNILVPYTYNTTKTVVEGVRKVVNSGSKVLMDKAIQNALPKSMKISMVSLKEGSFKSVKVIKQELLETELHAEETELKTLTA